MTLSSSELLYNFLNYFQRDYLADFMILCIYYIFRNTVIVKRVHKPPLVKLRDRDSLEVIILVTVLNLIYFLYKHFYIVSLI